MHCSHIISTMKKAAATKMAQTRHIYDDPQNGLPASHMMNQVAAATRSSSCYTA
jgi:hypothetical protein